MSPALIRLWELRSQNDATAICAYQSTPDNLHVITVTAGDTELIREEVGSEAEAFDEAAYLFDDFTFRGWSSEIYRDPRLLRSEDRAERP